MEPFGQDGHFSRFALRKISLKNFKASATSTGTPVFEEAWLIRVEQSLAACLGPIARVLVRNTLRRVRTADELCQALAAEIASEAERKRFLASVAR